MVKPRDFKKEYKEYHGTAEQRHNRSLRVLARRKYAAPFFLALGLAAVVLANPWESPLHTVMYALLPKFEELHQHWPERVAIVSYLSIAMLAGAAVESLKLVESEGSVAIWVKVEPFTERSTRKLVSLTPPTHARDSIEAEPRG